MKIDFSLQIKAIRPTENSILPGEKAVNIGVQ